MAEPFISRQDLSDHLGRDVTEDEGALAAVDAACEMCRTVAGQTFNLVEGDEITLDGGGVDSLVLPEFPATAAGTVEVGEEAVTDYALDTINGILYRTAGSATETNCLPPVRWPLGRQNIAITYDHGYAAEELPRDVRMVALSIASRLIVQGVAQAEEVGDVQITYGMNATDLTTGEKLILDKYRRTR